MPLAQQQDEMTPFQRMVLLEGMQQEEEEKQEANGGGGPSMGQSNSMSQPGGGGKKRGETVQYINQHEDVDDSK